MPIYSVQGPDGRIYDVEGPAGASEQDIVAAVKRQIATQPAQKTQETTFGGQTKEFFKGLVPGAIGLTEQAGIGISALLPDEQEKAAQQYIKEKAAAAKAPFAAAPGYEDTVGRKFGEATGSFLPFVATGPFGMAGRVAGYGLGIGAGAGTQVEKSAAEGATEGQQTASTLLGAAVGATEMFAPTRILKRLGEPVLDGATSYVKRALMAGGEEAAQEAASQAAQNIISKGIYKPEQEIIEQVGESAAYGGAVGALAQGLLDLAIGRRAPTTPITDEVKQARAEAEKQQEEEKVRLNSPEYAQEVFQKTQDLEAQRTALKQQLIPIKKGVSPETDYANNREVNRQIDAINKELKPLADEYVRVKPILKRAAEEARVAKLTPYEYALGMEPEQAAPQAQAEPEFYEQQIATPPAAPKVEDVVAQHAAQSIQLANEQQLAGEKSPNDAVADYVKYLMRNPVLADQIVNKRMQLPGLPAGVRNSAVLDALKLQIAPGFKQEMETRKAAFGAAKPIETESPYVQAFTSYMDELKDRRNNVGDDSFFDYIIQPKLEKIAEGKPPVVAVNPQLMPFMQPKQAERVRTKINELLDEIDQANTDRDVAQRSNNQDAATAAFERENQALEQINAFAAEAPAGELTKGRFPSAKVSPQASIYAKEVLRVRNEQNTALNAIEDKIDRLRRGDALGKEKAEPGKGVAAATPDVLAKQAEDARGKYISAVLEEAAIHRRVAGKPSLTYDEAIKAASRIHDVVGEWIDRSKVKPVQKFTEKPKYEEVIVQPAQKRAGKTIRGAITERRYSETPPSKVPAGAPSTGEWVKKPTKVFAALEAQIKPVTNVDSAAAALDVRTNAVIRKQIKELLDKGTLPFVWEFVDTRPMAEQIKEMPASNKEIKHFKAQIASVVDSLSQLPFTATRETPLLKQQFASTEAQKVAEARGETAKTAGGEMRRLREYVGNMIDKALTRNIPEGAVLETEDGPIRTQGIREALERVKTIIDDGKASKALLDAAQNQAERILRGEDLGTQVYARREAVPGKRVVENVPGREAETRFGERGRTYKAVGYEAALAPEGSALRELQDAIKLYERTAQEGEIAGEGAPGQGQLFPETRKDIGYIRATPANFAKSPQIKPVWEALDQARKLKAKTEANQKARSARDKQGFEQIEALKENIESVKNQMQFFLIKPGDFNIGKYSDADIAKMFASYPESGVTKEDKRLMDRYLQVSKQNIGKTKEQKEQAMSVFTEEEKTRVDKLIKDFNTNKIPEYAKNVQQALQTLALGQRLEGANNRLVELMQDNNAAVRKQADALNKVTEPLMDKLKLIKASLRTSVMLTEGQRAMIDSEVALQNQRNAYQKAMATAMGKARQRLSDTLGELLDPEIERARRSLKAAKTRLATVESQIEAAKKEMTEGTGQAPNLINNLQKVQGLVENIESAETELTELQELRFGEIENDVVVTEAMLDKDLKTEREYLEILERQLADMRKEPLTAVETGRPGELGKLKYPLSAQRIASQVKAQQAVVDEAQKRADEFQKDVKVWWPKVTAAFKKDGLSVKDLPGAVFEKGRKVAEINTPEQRRLDELRDKGMQAAKEVDEAAVRQRVKDKQLQLFDDEIFDARGEVQALIGPEDMNQLADIMADPNATNTKRAQATLKLGAMQKLASLEAQKQAFITGKPAKAPKAATVPSTTALAAAKPFRTGSGAGKAADTERLKLKAPQRRTLEQASDALRAEREEGTYGEGYEAPDLRGLFRTAKNVGNGMKAEEVTRLTNRIVQDWANVPEIQVVDNESGLPQEIQDQAKRDEKTGQIPGLYDPNTKIVYLVASNLGNGNDVAMTLAHEVAGHFGLREVLGGTYASTMNRVYEGNSAVRKQTDAKMQAEPNLDRNTAVEEVLAEMAETGATPANESALRQIYNAIKQWLANTFGIENVTDNEVKQIVANARKYVIEGTQAAEGEVDKSGILYRTKATYTNPEIAKNSDFVDKIVAKDRSWTDKLKANLTGLAFETQLVDRFAGFERLAKYMEPLKGTQMLYYLRMYDQRMNFVSQAVSNGAPAIVEKTRPDGRVERVLESKESANINNVVQILRDAQPMVGNAEAVNTMFTTYMAAIRAKNKGLSSLNFGEDVTQELLDKTMAAIEATPGLEAVFKSAKDEYNAYNRNLIDFVVSTGALSKEVGKRLLRENDYIPFYRERNGVAELLIGGESPIRIGSIAEQPYLHELVGGDRPILDFLTSSVQNTNLLMDMGMRNLATKNAVFELVDLKAAKFVKMAAGPDVVKFRDDGADRYAVIATEKVKIGNKEFDTGVPADILVKGMEGIPTQMPAMLRVMAFPAQVLRKAITLSPLYTAKQLFRDSLAAPILSGADFMPVIGALKEINSATKKTLERRGVTGGQQFVGGAEDLTKILRDVSEGKPGWMTALGKLEAMSMEADATTRRAQYNSYIQQGLSEMEATLLALESMNFNKRGASPSIHIANSMIPFFNAQIQGLNVLYKAATGKMPFNEQLRIREKMMQRGALMAVASFAYAALMQDDEAYKNANPDQKYGNWFIRVPGLDEPIKLPVPFEIGYIFKALPEALLNSMLNEHGSEEAVKAFKQILLQTVPGGSSYGIPQIMKPAIEAGLGKSFYTGRDILSAREKELLPEEQFRANTSELAKGIGKTLGISPIVFEQLVSGYTGTMGLAFMHALSVGVPTGESPEKAVKRLSEYPILGGAFQPNDAGGIINSVYERMNENIKVKQTFDKMVAEGRMSEAKALLQRRGNEFMQAEMAQSFKNDMSMLTQAERAIAASNMSPEAKREQLDKIRKIKTAVARTVREASDKTIRLSTPF
jgi:hypothetical protein